MLSVCLNFLYVLLAAYITGFLVLTFVGRFCIGRAVADHAGISRCTYKADSYLMAGLTVLTVYAQFFSLFYKVGLAANILLIIICIITVIALFGPLKKELENLRAGMTKGKTILYLLLFLLFAYGTSRGIIHYDTGLYHAQSIRWLEEYGVVKGLGNLHCRLAYNSSAFSLSALFSFSFLGGQSYHCMAGFFALILAKVCSEIGAAWKRKKLLLSDFIRIMGIYYLLIIFDEMVSPASDYFMVITVFYIIIRFLDLMERGEKSWILYGLLCLMGVYTMSLKLSAAFILLLVIKPAVMLIREKNLKGIFSFIGLGILIIAPYLIRNAVISGWIVYPFTAVDFLDVDWKIPKGIADYDAKEIQVWGRGIYDVARYDEPIGTWFSSWLAGQGAIDKLFICFSIVSFFVLIIAAFVIIRRKKQEMFDWLLVAATVDLSFMFWLFSAPLIRYGCVYVWLAATVTFGGLYLYMIRNKTVRRIVYTAIGLAACYKLFAFGKEIAETYDGRFFVYQKDYENFETETYEIDGAIFYVPTEGDRTGYEAFPSSPSEARMTLRGTDLEDGFRYK